MSSIMYILDVVACGLKFYGRAHPARDLTNIWAGPPFFFFKKLTLYSYPQTDENKTKLVLAI
jgi:hypothetical protein